MEFALARAMKRKVPIPVCCLAALLLCSCSSTEVLKCSYSRVSRAARERFKRNEWGREATRRSIVEEKPASLYIKYYDWEYPDTKIICQVTVERLDYDKTEVSVLVKDYDSWFFPLSHDRVYARKVLDLFKKRLGSLNWGRLPWTPENSFFKD